MNKTRKLFAAALLLLSGAAAAQNLGVSTNLADYADFGTLNVGASYAPGGHWTLEALVKYNPFTYGDGENLLLARQRTFAAGMRYWPWHVFSGWWLSGRLQYQEFCRGGIRSPETAEGDRYGGVLGAGYSYMLGKHFNLDFGFGVRAGYELSVSYACQSCGATLREAGKYFVIPDDFVLSVSYIF